MDSFRWLIAGKLRAKMMTTVSQYVHMLEQQADGHRRRALHWRLRWWVAKHKWFGRRG